MDDKNFINALRTHQREIMQLARRRLPVIVGRMAKDHFQNNFRLGGFLNNGLNKWKDTSFRYCQSQSVLQEIRL